MNTVWAEEDDGIVEKFNEKSDILSDREQDVIRKLYGINDEKKHSYDDLASEYNLPSGRIRQLEKRALRKLRRN